LAARPVRKRCSNELWELERGDEIVRFEPQRPIIVSISGAMDLAVDMAVEGTGIVALFE
jgi:hypothetical protein